jgi:PKD repeat protein
MLRPFSGPLLLALVACADEPVDSDLPLPDPPVAAFDVKLDAQTVTFTNRSDGADTYSWSFGDGATSTDESPIHVYPVPELGKDYDNFEVVLTAAGPGGTTQATATVAIPGRTIADFTVGPEGVVAEQEVVFQNTSVNGEPVLWDFGDGSTSILPNPKYTYALPGTYTVTLSVTGSGGTDEISAPVVIGLPQPTASFSAIPAADPVIANDTKVRFENTSRWASTYLWDFGDGATSTEMAPEHLYTKPGTYFVKLTTTNDAGTAESRSRIDAFLNPSVQIFVYKVEYHDMPWALSSASPFELPSTGTRIADGTMDISFYAGPVRFFEDNLATATNANQLYYQRSVLVRTAKTETDFPQSFASFVDVGGGLPTAEFKLTNEPWLFHAWEAEGAYINLLHQLAHEVEPEVFEVVQPYLHLTTVDRFGLGSYTSTANVDHETDTGTRVTVYYRHVK